MMISNVHPLTGESATAPLTPPDCDLRAFPFMPLDVVRLLNSRAWVKLSASPEVGFYRVNLWSVSWHQVPAASVEDDDAVLARHAMCDLRRWPKVRALALEGFVKCSDDRLYHRIVAEKANEAWSSRRAHAEAQRRRTEAARAAVAARRQERRPAAAPGDGSVSVTADASTGLSQTRDGPVGVPRVESREERKSSEDKGSSATLESAAPSDKSVTDNPKNARDALWQQGLPIVRDLTGLPDAGARRLLGKLLRDLGDDAAVTFQLLVEAQDLRPADPKDWLTGAAHERKRQKSRHQRIDEQLGITGMDLPP